MSKQNGREIHQQFTQQKILTVEEDHLFDGQTYGDGKHPGNRPESAGGDYMEFVQVAHRPNNPSSNQQPTLDTLLRQCIEEGRSIRMISQQIREGVSLREILNTSVELSRQFLQADRTVIYRFSHNGTAKVITESHRQNCSPMLGFSIQEPNFSLTTNSTKPQEHPVNLSQIEAIEDIQNAGFDPSYIKLLEFFNIKSMLIAPILENNVDENQPHLSGETKNNIWGLLIAHQCDQTRQWNSFEIEFISSLTAQLEIAVRQSRLQEQVRLVNNQLITHTQKRNAQLEKTLQTESVLKRITDQVKDSQGETQILQTAVRELSLLLDVEDSHSALYNDDHTTATILYQYNNDSDSCVGLPVEIAEFKEIYSQLLTGEPLQFCKLDSTRSSLNRSLTSDNLKPVAPTTPKAILACPIVHGGAILGDLWLFKDLQHSFSEVEIRLAQLVANHCAIAISQVRLYQAAQKQVAELEKLNALKDDFLSTVSHELRTPLSNMKMAIQMLAIALNQERSFFADLAKPEQEKSKVARYYQIVRNECEREISLIEDLLELQQLDTNSTAWAPAIIQIERILDQLTKTFQQKALQHQQKFRVERPAQLPQLVGDPVVVERVLTELLTNACKYTPSGEEISLTVEVCHDRLLLKVANTGIEIPQNELNQIFHKFYRIPKADRWQQGGTGLGLAVVQKLTERMGGKLEVSSEADVTCFRLELPVKLGKVE
ncbi:GAF domain-containing sensor histidine kinase [Ancylothrix sp. C2]|uniref:sensor histidine kinase n=1 Tax=Ancylothrix sp. D3o TaxID=2953691 RepID=UPI0021BAA11B|nr:GAF domain-containing sensor histidine kinase [Ancylothrix sp. D3o]MCT7951236.1 GAF domain-containing sensor histidine kinase [Ancylothrix sp. D3o]